jgi:mono/diheme cytochrome c family protein
MPGMKKLAFVLILAACGGGKTAATTTSTTPSTGSDTAAVQLPDLPFDKLDHDQQIEFMKQKVVPAMKPVFQNHDGKKYAEFGCVTCHGDQAKEGHFDMPNPGLPKIGYTQAYYAKFKPADLEWMGKEVMPTMAGLLKQEASYTDPAPKDGFGCGNCHTFAEGQKREDLGK